MHPTTDVKQPDPHDVSILRADEQLAHAYEQIKSADEQLTRADAQLSRLERDAARSRPRPSRDRPWLRGLVGLLLAAYIGAAAFVSQSSYGDAVTRRAPQLISAQLLPLEKLGLLARSNPSSVQLTAAEPAPLPQTAPQDLAPTAFPVSAEPAKSLQTMARDLANVEREIEQLKASQEQVARDTARVAELLKASQEQSELLIARASEQNLRPKRSAPQPQIAIGTRKPMPAPASPHASSHPQAPTQLRPEER